MKDQLVDRPPTIGDMKRSGAVGVLVRCPLPCRNLGALSFEKLGLQDDEIFAKIVSLKRIRCQYCNRVAKADDVVPDRGKIEGWGRSAD